MLLNKVCFTASILLCPALAAAEIVATLYGQTGGASAIGVGEVRLATSEYVLDLTYQRPLDTQFTSKTCWELGAQSIVDATIITPGEGVLRKSKCNGRFDVAIHSAWLGAQEFLDLIAKHQLESALAMRSPHARQIKFSEDNVDPANLDLNDYQRFSGGKCLGVLVKRGERDVVIEAGLDCRVKNGSRDVSLSLLMVPESEREGWKLKKLIASSLFSK